MNNAVSLSSVSYYGYRYLGYFYGAGVLSYGKVKRGRG
ncbi:hypothetical protein SAMN05444424_1350 [Bittarella massiliensis (ex Durand et al. 2017)]|uniref:Uncharacterized protein n=1 Tax=Bittarella massiliensis (ex Durand et al. 2017) TaxID=1720313 RepID=A0AAQ1MD06_9FIRM|nr:hypothetical protein SAMN05444424_1350 [Bittarella massiliensis (ex Durand et al. 2017)]